MDAEQPLDRVANGHDERGRFAKGNKLARGNPHARQTAALRKALYDAVQPDDLREVVATLLRQAKAGDVLSARELLTRLLGSSSESADLDARIEQMETLILQRTRYAP
jgi:GH24 family phage-related lysozyme (muramidase)